MKLRLPDEIEFIRKNSIFVVKALDYGFAFMGGRVRYSLTGETTLDEEISFVEDNPLRIGDIIDAISSPEVLHPLHLDIMISPIGRRGQYRMHVKWEGYDENLSLKLREEDRSVSRAELVDALRMLAEGAERIADSLRDGRITVKKAHEKAYQVLGTVFLEVLFPGLIRGPMLRFPFRRVTIQDFRNEKRFTIRLTPFEARRLCRFLSLGMERIG